jgi:hypothetical protein
MYCPRWLSFAVAAQLATACGGASGSAQGPETPLNEQAPSSAGSSQAFAPDPDTPATIGESTSSTEPEIPTFDIAVWAADRGIEVQLDVDRCEPARVGERPDDALWCFVHDDDEHGNTLRKQSLFVLSGKRLNKVFETPVAADLLPQKSGASAEPLVRLAVTTSDDGKIVTITDASPSCDDALARATSEFPDEPQAFTQRRSIIQVVCRARGRYRWLGASLRRVGGP